MQYINQPMHQYKIPILFSTTIIRYPLRFTFKVGQSNYEATRPRSHIGKNCSLSLYLKFGVYLNGNATSYCHSWFKYLSIYDAFFKIIRWSKKIWIASTTFLQTDTSKKTVFFGKICIKAFLEIKKIQAVYCSHPQNVLFLLNWRIFHCAKCPTLKSNIIWYLTIMALFLFIVAFLQSGNTLGSSSQLARPIFFLANLTFRPYKSASLECHHSLYVSMT